MSAPVVGKVKLPGQPFSGGGGGVPRGHRGGHAKLPGQPFTGGGSGVVKKARHVTHATKAKKGKVHRGWASPLAAGPWVLAGNDVLDTCVAAAVANSLLLSSGLRASDAELAGLPAGTIEDVLEYVATAGLSGARLARFGPVDAICDGLIVGVRLPGGAPHAVTLTGGLAVSWGFSGPLDGDLEEAWLPEWEAVA